MPIMPAQKSMASATLDKEVKQALRNRPAPSDSLALSLC